MEDRNDKWSCKRCTFLNWPKSIKCTICTFPKSSYYIGEEINQDQKDIYKIAPLIVNNEKNSLYCSKWLCHVCTYLNWPKSSKCTQCQTVRKVKISPTRSSSPSCSLKDYAGRDFSFPKREINSDCTSTSSSSSDNYYNDRNRAFTSVYQKWCCSVCTYENWPKALKCTLCLTRRDAYINDEPRNSPSPPGAQGGSF